ncbi:Uncharacterised protein [Staphylococcus aureus]|nr:Uncharacterised protein [Staphylococcus aureus]
MASIYARFTTSGIGKSGCPIVKLTQSSRPFMRFENWRILGALKYLELEFKESFICDTSNINQILSKNLEINNIITYF